MPETFALLGTARGGSVNAILLAGKFNKEQKGHPRNIISVENVQLQKQQVTTDSVSSLKPLARLIS
jgi:hypothetical protein